MATTIHDERTDKGHLVVTAHCDDGISLRVTLDGRKVADERPNRTPSPGAEITVGRVDFAGDRGRAIRAAYEAYRAANPGDAAFDDEQDAKEDRRAANIEARIAQDRRLYGGRPAGVAGAEADIAANYEGGLAAFRRDGRADRDRTPRHKGEIAGY